MNTTPDLFPRFADIIRQLSSGQIEDPRSVPQLRLASTVIGGRAVDMLYAPFDHLNLSARIVVIGLTPGRQQAANALRSAQQALRSGATNTQASERAKTFASFSGPMRSNLVAMLDTINVAKWLGIRTTATLWERDSHLIHFTSALRYPVFVSGENWSGSPDMLRSDEMRKWLEVYTGTELSLMTDAVFVPLGPKVGAALNHLADTGQIPRERILGGMPHPSGANAERIAYFLGSKPAVSLSKKTNAASIDTARSAMLTKVALL